MDRQIETILNERYMVYVSDDLRPWTRWAFDVHAPTGADACDIVLDRASDFDEWEDSLRMGATMLVARAARWGGHAHPSISTAYGDEELEMTWMQVRRCGQCMHCGGDIQ